MILVTYIFIYKYIYIEFWVWCYLFLSVGWPYIVSFLFTSTVEWKRPWARPGKQVWFIQGFRKKQLFQNPEHVFGRKPQKANPAENSNITRPPPDLEQSWTSTSLPTNLQKMAAFEEISSAQTKIFQMQVLYLAILLRCDLAIFCRLSSQTCSGLSVLLLRINYLK